MIRLEEVCLSFGEREILKNINLTVNKGEILVVIGPSGTGKSTLLRLLIGLLQPAAGKIWIGDQEISRYTERQYNELRLKMGMVFQYSALFDFLTVSENVAFGLRQHTKLNEAEIQRIVAEKLCMVGLEGQGDLWPNELSGGMKKRVSLARAIATHPEIVLYDEPAAGLDPIMTTVIDKLIVDTRNALGVTSLVVTHHMTSAFAIADRIVMIDNGEIIEQGSPETFRCSTNPVVQQFIHGSLLPTAERSLS